MLLIWKPGSQVCFIAHTMFPFRNPSIEVNSVEKYLYVYFFLNLVVQVKLECGKLWSGDNLLSENVKKFYGNILECMIDFDNMLKSLIFHQKIFLDVLSTKNLPESQF